MAIPVLPNATARRLFLHRHALAEQPSGPAKGAALHDLITRIGFVQVDSINTVERAHHMILWARRHSYRPDALKALLEKDRTLWEHWTHDASIVPSQLFPHWKHRFAADRERLVARWQGWQRDGFETKFDEVLTRVADHGPVTSADVGEGEARGSGGWWDWHPSKAALEYLWRVGELSVTRREGFRKVYDLTERVLPEAHRAREVPHAESVDWACASALDHLGFASASEIAAYWNAIPIVEARDWCTRGLAKGALIEVDVEGADGTPRRAVMRPEALAETAFLSPAPGQVRILSPFDPALRDRKRAERLFGFCYRIEVFVPEAKRQFGYYVFPVLQGERLIGRVDAKAFRQDSTLRVRAYWPEPGLRPSAARLEGLALALDRLAGFSGCDRVDYEAGWQRAPQKMLV